MKKLLEQYFPLMRNFPERVKRWSRTKLFREDPLGSRILRVRQCVLRAPVPAAADKKLLFISDWHWFDSQENRKLLERVEFVAQEKRPDYLILGGDMVEDADRIGELRGLLARLRDLAPVVLAVPGNWECGKRWLKADFWQQFYAEHGIHWLCNNVWQDQAIRFHGINDISTGEVTLPEKSLADKCGTIPVAEILLAHSPDTVIALDSDMALRYYDLALCGHNHGGQIRLPWFGALFCPSRYRATFDCGAFVRSGFHLKMLVSSGIGKRENSLRICCRPEVMLIKFRAARHYHLRKAAAK